MRYYKNIFNTPKMIRKDILAEKSGSSVGLLMALTFPIH